MSLELVVCIASQMTFLKSPASDSLDSFGASIAMDGTTLVVGCPGEDSSAVGLDGDPTDNSSQESGAAFVYELVGGQPTLSAYLKAAAPDQGDLFGTSVDIDGDTVVVGAPAKGQGLGINNMFGAAYVFERSGTTWVQTAILELGPNAHQSNSGYASCVAVHGDHVVVGAPGSDQAGVGGDIGFAWVYRRSNGVWTTGNGALLISPAPDIGDQFGVSVDIFADTIVVGAHQEDGGSSGVGGDPLDDSLAGSGGAYVFKLTGPSWQFQTYLKAASPELDARFGRRVAIWDELIAVGAFSEDSTADNSGTVYTFVSSGTSWAQDATIKATNVGHDDRFGPYVDLHEDHLLVGSRREDSASANSPADNSAPNSGAAYLYERFPTGWVPQGMIKAPVAGPSDNFSRPALGGTDVLAVGAPREDSGSDGVGGDLLDNSEETSGAVYILSMTDSSTNIYCSSKQSSAGCISSIVPGPTGFNPISGQTDFALIAASVQGQKTGILFLSLTGSTSLPFNGGVLCLLPPLKRGPVLSSGGSTPVSCDGLFATVINDGNIAPLGLDAGSGAMAWYQYWYRDPSNGMGPAGTSLTNAIEVQFQ